MREHPQFAEDIDLLALEMLGDEDCGPLREHLEGCGACRARYEEARALGAMLAIAAPPANPPARVRQRLLAQLDAQREPGKPARQPEAARAAESGYREAAGRPVFWHSSNLGWAIATLVILAVTAMLSEQYRRAENEIRNLQTELAGSQNELERTKAVVDLLHATDTVRVKLMSGTAPWPWPEGKVYYHPKEGLLFVASNMPPVEAGKVYQLWYVPEHGSPQSAGVFAPDVHGNATLMSPPSSKSMVPRAFAVTIERAGGSPEPTGPEVLTGAE
ncbi:MAG TPA: anti-sigma factor [Candidatus Acidoferrales bacterium]|nr:anti-sigma factor [Candidatus Acidoferrales bacterium]